MDTIIKVENLCKTYYEGKPYEVRAVADINLEVQKNVFVVFSGPSGSGKTTILSLIGTLDRPTKGMVSLYGENMTAYSDTALSRMRREKIGFVFQSFNLIPRLTSWENVAYPLIPLGYGAKERFDKAKSLLEKFGLGERIHHTPEELSGGQQQKVSIARALINDPEIIIADEPTSNIDVESVEVLTSILKELQNNGRTIIVSTHYEDLVKKADVVFKMNAGRIVM
ncbi:MAG: ABC transporter ATP-binding protein [Candidatus Brocadiales bacterium]